MCLDTLPGYASNALLWSQYAYGTGSQKRIYRDWWGTGTKMRRLLVRMAAFSLVALGCGPDSEDGAPDGGWRGSGGSGQEEVASSGHDLANACTEEQVAQTRSQVGDTVERAVSETYPCFSGALHFTRDGVTVSGTVPRSSREIESCTEFDRCSLAPCPDFELPERYSQQVSQVAEQAFREMGIPRCSYGFVRNMNGGASAELRQLAELFPVTCLQLGDVASRYVVVLDENGLVAEVTTQNFVLQEEIADCLQTALQGVAFPCIADFEICVDLYVKI
jgi:hypothetical protein